MSAALDIARKDLRQKVRDRSALLLGIVAPFALSVLFAMILGGVDQPFHGHWGLVDLDGGELATALEEGPLASLEADGIVTVQRLESEAAAREELEAGALDAAIVVPAGFSAGSLQGGGGTLELIADADAGISGRVAQAVLAGFAERADGIQLAIRTALSVVGGLPTAERRVELGEQARSTADPVVVVDAAAADRQAGYATYYAGAMAIIFIFFAAQFGLASIHAERRAGTLTRLLASPVRWSSILLGKLIVSLALAIVSVGTIMLGTGLLLGASWGDPIGVLALALAAAVAASGISLLAVAFTRTEDQAGSAVAIVTLSLAVIGGSFFPASQGSEALAQLGVITPHAWFLRGVNDLSSGGDLVAAAGPVAVLLAIGLATGALGMLRARRLVLG